MGIIISLGALLVYLWREKSSVKTNYTICSAVFMVYLVILLQDVVGFPSIDQFRRLSTQGNNLFNPNILWVPFDQGVDTSTFLNILAFIPLGIFLTVMWQNFDKFLPIFIFGLLFSLTIEVGQLFTLYRHSDINDIIMNTLGVLVGWVLAKWSLTWDIKRGDGKNLDWVVYFIIAFLSVFIFG